MITREEAQKLVQAHLDELERQKTYWESIQRALTIMLLRETIYVLESVLKDTKADALERQVYQIFLSEVEVSDEEK